MTKSDLSTQPYRGTRDFFPGEMQKLKYIFSVWREVVESFGYEEYLSPLLESWELYASKNVSGEEIVNEQLYWFEDQSGRKIAIRPEMTPSVARMVAAQGRQLPKPLRWYSIANFMRYEKPQKGRAREFFQLNLDIFGDSSIYADAEIIEVAIAIMKKFNATERMFEIRVNNRKWIDEWLEKRLQIKDDRLKVTRIIDRMGKQSEEKNIESLKSIGLDNSQIDQVIKLPQLSIDEVRADIENSPGAQELNELFRILEQRDLLNFVKFDASLMRGLDYYTGNVFEQFDLNPDNRRSLFGGGRYDGLTDLFGVKDMPAVGFAPGDLTLVNFLENWNLLPDFKSQSDALVTVFNPELENNSWQAAQKLRDAGIKTELYLKSTDSISQQMSYANKKKIPNVIIIGEGEVDSGNVVWKNLQTGEQQILPIEEVCQQILNLTNEKTQA